MTEETELMGEVYQAESGQWSFVIKDDDGEEFGRGGGFESKLSAQEELEALLQEIEKH